MPISAGIPYRPAMLATCSQLTRLTNLPSKPWHFSKEGPVCVNMILKIIEYSAHERNLRIFVTLERANR